MEAKIFALVSAKDEAKWLKDSLMDHSFGKLQLPAITIYCDNQELRLMWLRACY